ETSTRATTRTSATLSDDLHAEAARPRRPRYARGRRAGRIYEKLRLSGHRQNGRHRAPPRQRETVAGRLPGTKMWCGEGLREAGRKSVRGSARDCSGVQRRIDDEL